MRPKTDYATIALALTMPGCERPKNCVASGTKPSYSLSYSMSAFVVQLAPGVSSPGSQLKIKIRFPVTLVKAALETVGFSPRV